MIRTVVLALLCAMGSLPAFAQRESAPTNCKWKEVRTVKNVERIFMHTPTSYSFLFREEGSDFGSLASMGHGQFPEVRFYTDVPKELLPWVQLVVCIQQWPKRDYYRLEIHIKAFSDIEAAGWNAGKGGAGITQVIQ